MCTFHSGSSDGSCSGLYPNTSVATACSATMMPSVAVTRASADERRIGRSTSRWISTPAAAQITSASTHAAHAGHPSRPANW